MGCSGSKDVDCRARLDDVKRDVAGQAGAEGDAGLSVIKKCASELKEVMEALIDAGGKDLKNMQKVDLLSDDVLENVTRRITVELLKRSDFDTIKADMLAIAKDLDTVRATPATGVVEGSIKAMQDKIDAELEKKAKGHVPELKGAMEKVKDPKTVVPRSMEVLDLVEKAHAEAPASKTVTDMLLKCVIGLSSLVLRLKAGWVVDIEAVKGVQEVAERIDGLAGKLVVLMEAAWDPPMAPQIEQEVKNYSAKLCKELLAAAQKALNENDVGGTFDALDSLRPWWPRIKEIGGVSLELVGLFSKVHTCASQEFTKASKEGDTETAEAIRDFANKFDSLRPAFEGLPPPTEAEQQGLAAALQLDEAKVRVEKQLGVLDAEFAKTCDDDKTTNLSLAITVQALEALVPVWATVFEAEPSYGEHLQKTCGNIEAWALKAAANCPSKKVDGLLKFAESYDDRRVRLSPPEAEGGSLRGRIAEKAADTHLKAAQGELAKEKGLNPVGLLDSLRSCSAALQISGMESGAGGLSSAFAATADRVTKTFADTLAAGDGRKEDMLQAFSADFDEVQASFREAAGLDGAVTLAARLTEEREKFANGQVAAVGKALPPGGSADLTALIKALSLLRSLWSKLPEGSSLPASLSSALAPIEDCLDAAGRQVVEARDGAAADALVQQAGELDSIIPALIPERYEDNLRARLVGPAVSAHVRTMEVIVLAEESMDCAVLAKELATVQPLVQEFGCSSDVCKELQVFVLSLEAVLLRRVVDVGAGGAKAELAVAEAADETLSILSKRPGSDPGLADVGIHKKLDGSRVVAVKLGEMTQELAKPSGMNPKVVVQVLQALEPVWAPVAEFEAFKQRLVQALDTFHERMQEACRKAVGSEAKVKAILAFAEDADAKQQALVPHSPGLVVRSFRESLTRVLADDHLKAVEAELAKETGMNSAQLLKSLGELNSIWPQIGEADAGPALDSIADLRKRAEEVGTKVHSRMKASFREAVSSGNKKKKEALLKFAQDFDAAYDSISGAEPGGDGSLHAILQTEADG